MSVRAAFTAKASRALRSTISLRQWLFSLVLIGLLIDSLLFLFRARIFVTTLRHQKLHRNRALFIIAVISASDMSGRRTGCILCFASGAGEINGQRRGRE